MSSKKHSSKRNKTQKPRVLFDPDGIATAIHQALQRDLEDQTQIHEYGSLHPLVVDSFRRQVQDTLKKYLPTHHPKDELERQTFEKFLEVNVHIGDTNRRLNRLLPWFTDKINRQTAYMDKIHLRARSIAHFILGRFEEEKWFDRCKNSGGSSIGVNYNDTSVEKKFTFPISVTERAIPLMERYFEYDSQLCSAVVDYNSYLYQVSGKKYQTVEGSRATTVDKTVEKRRMICIEPTANMFLQQGLMLYLYDLLASIGLDVELLPDLHKVKAKLASMTLNNATIDWSSASDCVSIELLRWLIPPDWFWALDVLRCPVTSVNGVAVELNMFATMGNATTFPMETLVFWTYAIAVIQTENEKTNSLIPNTKWFKQASVFGDDCIVPTSCALKYMGVMQEVGFIVNKEKSFYGSERFRESCGGDYLQGYDVRPFCLKAPPSTSKSNLEPWLYTIMNALIPRYISYFGGLTYLYDKALFRLFEKLVRQHELEVKLVPSYFPDDAGLKMSHDIQRFVACYDVNLSKIARSHHGTLKFRYCRFVYRQPRAYFDGIRYYTEVKRSMIDDSSLSALSSLLEDLRPRCHDINVARNLLRLPGGEQKAHLYDAKRKGGYVVASGLSGHWSVPKLTGPH